MSRRASLQRVQCQKLLEACPAAPDGLTAGLDEAGRGCLAGPVVAAAVIFPDGFDMVGLGDSKAISARERERLAVDIRHMAHGWGLGLVWMDGIARHNILHASLLAMTRAVAALRCRMKADPSSLLPARVLIDGNQLIPSGFFTRLGIPLPQQQAIVGGDALVPSISAASILAKTFRDDLMTRLDARWPQYGFARHRGYGTREHKAALALHGPCPLHRMGFRGVRPMPVQAQGRLC